MFWGRVASVLSLYFGVLGLEFVAFGLPFQDSTPGFSVSNVAVLFSNCLVGWAICCPRLFIFYAIWGRPSFGVLSKSHPRIAQALLFWPITAGVSTYALCLILPMAVNKFPLPFYNIWLMWPVGSIVNPFFTRLAFPAKERSTPEFKRMFKIWKTFGTIFISVMYLLVLSYTWVYLQFRNEPMVQAAALLFANGSSMALQLYCRHFIEKHSLPAGLEWPTRCIIGLQVHFFTNMMSPEGTSLWVLLLALVLKLFLGSVQAFWLLSRRTRSATVAPASSPICPDDAEKRMTSELRLFLFNLNQRRDFPNIAAYPLHKASSWSSSLRQKRRCICSQCSNLQRCRPARTRSYCLEDSVSFHDLYNIEDDEDEEEQARPLVIPAPVPAFLSESEKEEAARSATSMSVSVPHLDASHRKPDQNGPHTTELKLEAMGLAAGSRRGPARCPCLGSTSGNRECGARLEQRRAREVGTAYRIQMNAFCLLYSSSAATLLYIPVIFFLQFGYNMRLFNYSLIPIADTGFIAIYAIVSTLCSLVLVVSIDMYCRTRLHLPSLLTVGTDNLREWFLVYFFFLFAAVGCVLASIFRPNAVVYQLIPEMYPS